MRVKSGVVESGVSAIDRMGDAPDLTDYFQKFLEVVRDRDTKELSERLNEVIRGTLQKCKTQLPDQDDNDYCFAAPRCTRQPNGRCRRN